MSATGTVIMAGLGATAGVFAASVVMEDWQHRPYDKVNAAAVGGAVGAALGAIISVMVESAEAKKVSGAVGAPPRMLGFP